MKRERQDEENGDASAQFPPPSEGGDAMEDALEQMPNDSDDSDDDDDDDDDDPLRTAVQCWDDAVVASEALIQDAHTLWDTYGGDRTVARSFWVDADATPRCLLEALALEIADFHLDGSEYAGVEIWTQWRSADAPHAGLAFHFDKDERLAAGQCGSDGEIKGDATEQRCIWKHPVVATATYLTTGGAPLVVFATSSPEGDDEEKEDGDKNLILSDEKTRGTSQNAAKKIKRDDADTSIPQEAETAEKCGTSTAHPACAWMCYPRKGRHVAFAGNLLHGVVEELIFAKPADRLSLLVNVWLDHRPAGIEVLGDDVLKKLCGTHTEKGLALSSNGSDGIPEPIKPEGILPHEPLLTLKEHVEGETGPLPSKTLRTIVQRGDASPFIFVPYETKNPSD